MVPFVPMALLLNICGVRQKYGRAIPMSLKKHNVCVIGTGWCPFTLVPLQMHISLLNLLAPFKQNIEQSHSTFFYLVV